MRTIVFGSLLLFVLQACGNASSPEYESGDGTARHVSIAYLKSLCRGVLHPVTEDLWIEGCVVGNDLYGEFPDALVVEDESGGIEVLIDAKRLYRTFDSGSTVRVYCNGLALVITGARYSWGFRPPQNIFWTVFRQSRSDVMFAASGTGRSISCLGNSPSGRWLQAVSPLTYDSARSGSRTKRSVCPSACGIRKPADCWLPTAIWSMSGTIR